MLQVFHVGTVSDGPRSGRRGMGRGELGPADGGTASWGAALVSRPHEERGGVRGEGAGHSDEGRVRVQGGGVASCAAIRT